MNQIVLAPQSITAASTRWSGSHPLHDDAMPGGTRPSWDPRCLNSLMRLDESMDLAYCYRNRLGLFPREHPHFVFWRERGVPPWQPRRMARNIFSSPDRSRTGPPSLGKWELSRSGFEIGYWSNVDLATPIVHVNGFGASLLRKPGHEHHVPGDDYDKSGASRQGCVGHL